MYWGQLEGEERNLVTLESGEGSWPHSWPDRHPSRGPLWEQNPEAKIHGSGGKQISTAVNNAEGWSSGVKVSHYIMEKHCKGFGHEGRSGAGGGSCPTARMKNWKWAEVLAQTHTQKPGTVMLDSESVPPALLSRIFPVSTFSPSWCELKFPTCTSSQILLPQPFFCNNAVLQEEARQALA